MKPFENTPLKNFICAHCGGPFQAKRMAKFCSELCAGRARPPRPKPTPEQYREWRKRRLEEPGYRERINKAGNDRAKAIRQWLSDYKASVGCTDCGFNDPRALDFDHVGDNKAFNVCFAKSIAQAKKEIAKCVVRCANCHRIITHTRLQQLRKSA